MSVPKLDRARVRDTGTLAPGASKSRFVLTDLGPKHVKFLRSDGEGDRALASELLTFLVLRELGVTRPGAVLVDLPEAFRSTEAFATVTCALGFGTDPLFAQDLTGGLIADAAKGAPEEELLAQAIVLEWVQSHDHGGKNFLLWEGHVLAIDFSSAPSKDCWKCHPFEVGSRDQGGLNARLRAINDAVRPEVIDRFDRLSEARLTELVGAIPEDWAPLAERTKLIRKLLDRKEEIRERFKAA